MGRHSFQTAERKKGVKLFKDGKGLYFENYRTLGLVGPSILIKRPQGPRSKASPWNSLKKIKPSVACEWHPSWNMGVKPTEIKQSCSYLFYWSCRKDKTHQWVATCNSRSNGHGCPMCSRRSPTKNYNLGVQFPDHAEEWHPTNNGDLTPWDVTPYSNLDVYWKRKGTPFDEWSAKVNARTLKGGTGGKGYRSKLKGSSLFENFIYWQLKAIFSDTENRTKKDGREIDICIPSLKLGVEYDSLYYHGPKKEKDRLKIRQLEKRGWRIVRLRQFGLKKERGEDLVLKKGDDGCFKWLVVEKVLKFIRANTRSGRSRIKKYLKGKKLKNLLEFRRSVIHINNVALESSLEFRCPEVAKSWDYKENYPLTPRDVSFGSGGEFGFKCCKCGHQFISSPRNMIRGLQYKSKGCPACTGRLVTPRDNLKAKFPQLIKSSWDYLKNKASPETYSTNSNEYAHWICRYCRKSLLRRINSVVSHGKNRKYFFCCRCRGNEIKEKNKTILVPASYRMHKILRKEWDSVRNKNLSLQSLTREQSKKPLWWICAECKKPFRMKISIRMKNFQRGYHGCSNCRRGRAGLSASKTWQKRTRLKRVRKRMP